MGESENGEASVDNHHDDDRELEEESLYGAVWGLFQQIFFPDPRVNTSIFHRVKDSFRENLPHLRDASRNSWFKLLRWARRGSPLRLLLLISVGTITLLTLTGLLVFLLFLGAATTNAVILSLFVSLAVAGGVLAFFFACVAAIYVGAVSIAVFIISSVTVSAIIAVLIVTGWLGFFWVLWATIRRSVGIAKHSASITGSALSAYATALHVKRHHRNDKDD